MEVSPLAAARVAEDLGIAALAGGNLFGRVALHHAVERLPRPEDRGLVVNAAWHRYGTVNSLSLAAVVGGGLATRNEKRDPALTMAKDGAVGAGAVTRIAPAAAGGPLRKAAPGRAGPP